MTMKRLSIITSVSICTMLLSAFPASVSQDIEEDEDREPGDGESDFVYLFMSITDLTSGTVETKDLGAFTITNDAVTVALPDSDLQKVKQAFDSKNLTIAWQGILNGTALEATVENRKFAIFAELHVVGNFLPTSDYLRIKFVKAPEPKTPESKTSTHTILFEEKEYKVSITSSSDVKSINFSQPLRQVTILLDDSSDTMGFANVTLEKELLEGPYSIVVDGIITPDFEETGDSAQSSIYLKYVPGLHELKITGSRSVTICYEDSCSDLMTSLSNGSVKSADVDRDFASIILAIETSATEDGELMIVLPRELIDSKFNGDDDDFIILVNGEETDYQEHSASTTERALTIPIFVGAEEVEILGTQVIPEFPGAIMAVIGVTVASSIALSRFKNMQRP
ncbi:MAG: hypothetical protein ACE5J2_02965 [Nitrososphaerales archaeon]